VKCRLSVTTVHALNRLAALAGGIWYGGLVRQAIFCCSSGGGRRRAVVEQCLFRAAGVFATFCSGRWMPGVGGFISGGGWFTFILHYCLVQCYSLQPVMTCSAACITVVWISYATIPAQPIHFFSCNLRLLSPALFLLLVSQCYVSLYPACGYISTTKCPYFIFSLHL